MTLGIAAFVLACFYAFFRFSDWGVAMRATAFDRPEYDLTGNRSGVCPECGAAVKGAAV